MKKYQIIGGQYKSIWYGESDFLRGAQIIARRNKEYWDNWQGWHTPSIYKGEIVAEYYCDDEGRPTEPVFDESEKHSCEFEEE